MPQDTRVEQGDQAATVIVAQKALQKSSHSSDVKWTALRIVVLTAVIAGLLAAGGAGFALSILPVIMESGLQVYLPYIILVGAAAAYTAASVGLAYACLKPHSRKEVLARSQAAISVTQRELREEPVVVVLAPPATASVARPLPGMDTASVFRDWIERCRWQDNVYLGFVENQPNFEAGVEAITQLWEQRDYMVIPVVVQSDRGPQMLTIYLWKDAEGQAHLAVYDPSGITVKEDQETSRAFQSLVSLKSAETQERFEVKAGAMQANVSMLIHALQEHIRPNTEFQESRVMNSGVNKNSEYHALAKMAQFFTAMRNPAQRERWLVSDKSLNQHAVSHEGEFKNAVFDMLSAHLPPPVIEEEMPVAGPAASAEPDDGSVDESAGEDLDDFEVLEDSPYTRTLTSKAPTAASRPPLRSAESEHFPTVIQRYEAKKSMSRDLFENVVREWQWEDAVYLGWAGHTERVSDLDDSVESIRQMWKRNNYVIIPVVTPTLIGQGEHITTIYAAKNSKGNTLLYFYDPVGASGKSPLTRGRQRLRTGFADVNKQGQPVQLKDVIETLQDTLEISTYRDNSSLHQQDRYSCGWHALHAMHQFLEGMEHEDRVTFKEFKPFSRGSFQEKFQFLPSRDEGAAAALDDED